METSMTTNRALSVLRIVVPAGMCFVGATLTTVLVACNDVSKTKTTTTSTVETPDSKVTTTEVHKTKTEVEKK
jgi:hypothetical protein